ncbi:MAG: type II 3-dehydroquinate dehydratase [Spirochaetota bacterium]
MLKAIRKKTVYVINGPNLNMLGVREPVIYGETTLKEIINMLKKYARSMGVRIKSFQSNYEGEIIDKLQSLYGKGYIGVILNPGAFTHYSYAIRDAITASGLKVVEVHISDIEKREDFRKLSVIKDVCIAQVKGLGPRGYLEALNILFGKA